MNDYESGSNNEKVQELRKQLGEVTQDHIEITRNLQSVLAEIKRISKEIEQLREDESGT